MQKLNPIKEYKIQNQMTYEQMSKKTGMPVITLKDIATADNTKLLNTQLKTYLTLKEKLNLDLAKNIKY